MYHVLQGVKGALGDPGLPGPTGIRGEFGDRVSLTCVIIKMCLDVMIHSLYTITTPLNSYSYKLIT